MRETLVGLVEKADLAIGSCAGVVEETSLEAAARAARNVRTRISYPDEMLVVALAGGTGSGKSSLLNAIAGEELADVGGVRPTTNAPLAIVSPDRLQAIQGYLDDLGVEARPVAGLPGWLCLVDLPDTDSVEVDHRFQVEGLLPRLDLVVWVTNPEKYRDAALHNRYLRPLAVYADQFRFVLNQTDRLGSSVGDVLADFHAALVSDGIPNAVPLPMAADPPAGPPMGVTDLVDDLEEIATSHVGLYVKLLTDLDMTAAQLLHETGGSGLGFEARVGSLLDECCELVADGETAVASTRLTGIIEELAGEAGGLVAERLVAISADVPAAVQAAADTVPSVSEVRRRVRWSDRQPSVPRQEKLDHVRSALNESVVVPSRAILAERAHANAVLADLVLSVATARSDRS